MHIHNMINGSLEKGDSRNICQDTLRILFLKIKDEPQKISFNPKKEEVSDNHIELQRCNKLTSDTKNILELLAKEYSNANHYSPYYSRGKLDKVYQNFLKSSLFETSTTDQKTNVYFTILKATLETANNFHYSVKSMYRFSNDNFIGTIIEEGINLPLKDSDLKKFFHELENSSIENELVKKIRIGLQFVKEFGVDDLLYGTYSNHNAYNSGLSQYNSSLYQYSHLKNTNTVATIVATINSPKTSKTALSPLLQDIYKYFIQHPTLKYTSLEGQKNWKRISKVLLQYCLDKPIKTHFILDSLNMDYVLSKRTNRDGSHMITCSELRFIYRQWLKNSELVDNKIIFWQNGQKVIAPWKQNPGLWSTYKSLPQTGK